MDTLRPIIYRGYSLNDPTLAFDAGEGLGKGAQGSIVDSFDISDVDVIQFLEKRALEDGMDAGDVFQATRRVRMTGTLYGKTRGLFYDEVDAFMAATSAVLAQRDEPADKGYRPLYYTKATGRTVEFPGGEIELYANVLPRVRRISIDRDQQGGSDSDGLAAPWQATFLMKDPLIYGVDAQEVDLSGGGTVSGDFVNRGNYISRLNMLLAVGAEAGTITVSAGGATIVITVPLSSGARIIRYKGTDKILTFEENSVEVVRFDKLTLDSSGSHPIVPPGTSPYVVTFSGVTPTAGSIMWYNEAYA